MPELVPVSKIKTLQGKYNGTSNWVLIDQDKVNLFADATGDYQWIHVDIDKAKEGPFGKTIGHGYLTLSLIPVFSESSKFQFEDLKMAINYGLNKVRFTNPVRVGSRVRSKMTISSVDEKGTGKFLITTTHVVEIEGESKPACIAESLSMLFF